MTHRVEITKLRRGIRLEPETRVLIRRAVSAALEAERVDIPCQVHVGITDDRGIAALNLSARGIDAPTDVLSFPAQDIRPGEKPAPLPGDMDPESGRLLLGDMALSLERAAAQAEEYGHGLTREVAFLVVHSVLHLLGYDHMEEGPRGVMRAREEEILRSLGITRE